MPVLTDLIRALQSAEIEIVDLTADLSAETPLLPLPPQWSNTVPFQLHEISRYDERGPAWYWNWFSTGEHTGTHFDAPIHWVSGKDLPLNSVDRIPARLFVGPACVIDITEQSARDPDFLVDVAFIEGWETRHGRIAAGAWVLLRSNWSKRTLTDEYLNMDANGPH